MLDDRFYDDGVLTVEGYKEIYDLMLSLADDAEGYGLFEDITDEDVEKCKWIAAIIEVLDDVPARRMKHIFNYRRIEFDSEEFHDEQYGE